MRIAIFSDTFLPQVNGVTNTLSRMKEYMDQNGIEYRFLVPGERTEGNYFGSIISFQSMNFFLYPECRIAMPSYQIVKITLEKFKPDIIHLVTPFSLGLMGLKYARDHMVPVVASYHTDFPKYLRYYNLQFFEKAVWHFFRWFHSFSQINFCPSRITFDQLKSNNINNLMIWSRGIDNKVFSPEKRVLHLESGTVYERKSYFFM
ncbi:glycosyltransferase [Desulfitibacter alkalitolerans]|uniref:glycosyltransferase n=1 Tax=Desulfitibacter alkalitolerans TaxID=264641 RepID=UPI00068419E2|nr:glycosyltransferase [Desulfitibacter alkalitolerans]